MISSIDEVVGRLKNDKVKLAALMTVAKENQRKIDEIIKENKALNRQINAVESKKQSKPLEIEFTRNIKKISEQKVKCIDVSYFKDYLACSSDVSDLEIFMPDMSSNNYDDIIACLLMDIQKDIVLLSNMKSEVPLEEQEEFQKELDKLYFMQSLINDYNEEKTNNAYHDADDIELSNKPVLLYAITSQGKPAFLRDLKYATQEQLQDFLVLFESLQSGNFKNLKKVLTKDNDSLAEVKLNQARITFDHLTENYYVITGAFVKKTTNSRLVRAKILSSKKLFNENEKDMLESINDHKFIDDQLEITKEAYRILGGEK